MNNKRVLITGNLGYNGAWVTKLLNESGYETVGLDTEYYKDCFYDNKDFVPKNQIRKDIRNITEEDLDDVDIIIHLAALSNDAVGELNPIFTEEINKNSTIKLAKLGKKKKAKKFIYASTCSVYGIHDPNEHATEESKLEPLTVYAKAKVAAEDELKKLNDDSFKVIIMRNATMHGLSPKLRLDLVLNNLVASAVVYNTVKILSDGTPWRPLLSVFDFARFVLHFIENDAKHIIYNIGFNEENYQIKDLGEMINKIMGIKVGINPNKTPDERSYKVDFNLFFNEFPNFKIELSVRDSIKELFNAYKENNLNKEDFTGSKYFRIRAIKKLIEEGKLNNNLEWKNNNQDLINSEEIKSEIIKLVEKYHKTTHKEIPSNKVPASGKVYDKKELQNLVECSLEGWWTEGKWNKEFENKLKEFVGIKHVLTVNSGSSANLIALKALTSMKLKERRIKEGDEIITVAAGFPTTINPILQIGAVPVFVDVELGTYNPNINEIEKAVNEKTKVIFLAHTLGNPFNIKKIKELCEKHNLWLIEDNCDALGSKYDNKYTGTFGDLATLSFYPAHHITTAEGGAVLTNNPLLYRIIRSIRDWGRDCWCPTGKDNTCGKRFNWQLGKLPHGYDHKFTFSEIGYNLKMTDFQAAIGVAQMDKLESFIKKRKENYKYLHEKIEEFNDFFILPKQTENSDPCWFGFPITIKDKKMDRTDFLKFLNENNIGTRLLFAGNITKQPYFVDNNIKYRQIGNLENTNIIMNNTFWIGVYQGIDRQKIDYVIKKIKEFVEIKKEKT